MQVTFLAPSTFRCLSKNPGQSATCSLLYTFWHSRDMLPLNLEVLFGYHGNCSKQYQGGVALSKLYTLKNCTWYAAGWPPLYKNISGSLFYPIPTYTLSMVHFLLLYLDFVDSQELAFFEIFFNTVIFEIHK